MNSIGIILGRGVEGCGVSKMALEQAKWYAKNGYSCSVFANADKSWSRKESHSFDGLDFHHVKFSDESEIENILKRCLGMEYVIIDSVPSKSHKEASIAGFNKLVQEIKSPIVFVQLDHSIHSIVRNAGMMEAVDKSDVIFSFGVDNDFSRKIKKEAKKAGKEFDKEIFTYSVGFPFDEIRKQYWKPIEEQDPLVNRWIGRCSGWKGYKLMFDFHNRHLKTANYATVFEGIERSPHYLTFKQTGDFHYHIGDNPNSTPYQAGEDPYVFGIYNNHEMMERMSVSGFGYQLSILKPRFITNQVEYTHCEIVAAGAIPVFRKAWGDIALHRTLNVPLTQCQNTGTIWLDETNNQAAFDQLHKLANDPIMRNEWREMAFDFYKNHQDSDHVLRDMHNKITNKLSTQE